MKRLLLILLLCCGMVPHDLQAQQPQREQLQRAQTYSWWVRVLRGDSIIATGRVRALTDDAVRIDTVRIPLSELTMLERQVRIGGGWRRGAITGSIIMGGLGVLVGTALCGLDDVNDGCGGAIFLGAAFAAGLGFPIGGMIGEVVRPAKHEWQTVWPARN